MRPRSNSGLAAIWTISTISLLSGAELPVNPHAGILADFSARVQAYAKLHRSLAKEDAALRPTTSPEDLRKHAASLRARIRAKRGPAEQGNIFTPAIAGEFRRLTGIAMGGGNEARVKKSLRRAEPVRIPVRVNEPYPSRIPLQSTPPTLLLNLPRLEPELEYRIVGSTIVLLDTGANLVVDILPNAIQ